jgi:hypothetical protein
LTEAKAIMIEQGRSSGESYLVELIERRLSEFASGVIAGPSMRLCDRLQNGAMAAQGLPAARYCTRCARPAGSTWAAYTRPSSDQETYLLRARAGRLEAKSELRRMVEEVPPPAAVRLVK